MPKLSELEIKEIKNTLRTLHGMECRVTLSDGTEVHLFAVSNLTYPVDRSEENWYTLNDLSNKGGTP